MALRSISLFTSLTSAVMIALLASCGGEGVSATGGLDGSTSTSSGAGGSSSSSGTPGEAWPKDPATGLRVPELGPVPPLPEWADNPATEQKKIIGRAMFSDPRLSGSGRDACSLCHAPTVDFQSATPLDLPDRSYPNIKPTLPRHSPSLLNIVYAPMLRWDGSYYKNLYETMVLPFAEANMNLTPEIAADDVEEVDIASAQKTLYKKLTVDALGYVKLFQDAFGQDITKLTPAEVWLLAGKALSVYVRIAVSRDSAFDKWNAGDDSAMSDSAVRGLVTFRSSGRCIACHNGPLFTDYRFHNMSLSLPDPAGKRPDEGRYKVTMDEADRGAFLTPGLRSCSDTSPYFHNGSKTSLGAVIRHLTSEDARKDPLHDRILDGIQPLTDSQVTDLVAFLKALRGAPIPLSDLAGPAMLP